MAFPGTTAQRPQLDVVYEAEVDWVVQTLRRLGVPERDQDDLAHDLFVVVHRRLADYDPTRPIRPWLFGIAFRLVSDHRRRVRHHREQSVAVSDEAADPRSTIDAQAHARHALGLVARALDQLDYERRAVFVMHELDGFSIPEIAKVIDAPLNTLYSHLRRARQQFRAAVEALGIEPEADHG